MQLGSGKSLTDLQGLCSHLLGHWKEEKSTEWEKDARKYHVLIVDLDEQEKHKVEQEEAQRKMSVKQKAAMWLCQALH